MTLEEALKINGETVSFCCARLMDKTPPPLSRDYSLRELIDARDMVAQHDKESASPNGTITMHWSCDDRMIAAMYAMQNYPAELPGRPTPILVGADRAIFCVQVQEASDE